MNIQKNKIAIERLTALWALNECGLGGFMHAFSSPFTGIVVGGISILLISLIARHSKNVWPTLLKALSIVLLVKLSVSPHSPITAYFAISFQTFFGMVLYSLFSINHYTIVFLGAVTFLESALQKLLTLTIIYGQSLWDAMDVYTNWVSAKLSFLPFAISSKTLIIMYVGFYGLAGIIVGFLIVRVIKLMQSIETSYLGANLTNIIKTESQTRLGKYSKRLVLFWGIMLLIIILPLFAFRFNTSRLASLIITIL
ncbi:hypothetical protein [Winogradskyella sp.]|uniref:hypothetical protein n=1 Tax=Winogradskyella sp. TaxID=1883156 RepID=UPI0025F9EB37|nr:hypothetical protein [Winogradskyella sp.]MBT8245680.1 hypothetical protein [Winogradskyella sp.]